MFFSSYSNWKWGSTKENNEFPICLNTKLIAECISKGTFSIISLKLFLFIEDLIILRQQNTSRSILDDRLRNSSLMLYIIKRVAVRSVLNWMCLSIYKAENEVSGHGYKYKWHGVARGFTADHLQNKLKS